MKGTEKRMNLKHNYFILEEAVTNRFCDHVIEYGKYLKEQVAKTWVYNPDTLSDYDRKELEKTRKSKITWMSDNWLYRQIQPVIHEVNALAGWNFQWSMTESFQFTKYGQNQFYGWHADGNSCHLGKYKRAIPGVTPRDEHGMFPRGYTDNPNMVNKIRKLSLTINLNLPGEYEGGNLKFDFGPHAPGNRYHECTEIRPQGSIIVFPSYIYHQVTPVTNGTRYSLVLWTLGKPFQ